MGTLISFILFDIRSKIPCRKATDETFQGRTEIQR